MQKRPTDSTIRIARIVFGLILIGALYYNLIVQGNTLESNFFWQELSTSSIDYIKYAIVGIGIIPVIMGTTNICLLKKKYIRIIQIIFGIILFYISSKIVEGPSLDVDSLIALMGIFPLLAGITGKCITSNCMRHAEKITKIRV